MSFTTCTPHHRAYTAMPEPSVMQSNLGSGLISFGASIGTVRRGDCCLQSACLARLLSYLLRLDIACENGTILAECNLLRNISIETEGSTL
jgi:hypothetical protein